MNARRFEIIEGETTILSHKGVWRQADVFDFGGQIYAKVGSGFVGLLSSGGTTGPGY